MAAESSTTPSSREEAGTPGDEVPEAYSNPWAGLDEAQKVHLRQAWELITSQQRSDAIAGEDSNDRECNGEQAEIAQGMDEDALRMAVDFWKTLRGPDHIDTIRITSAFVDHLFLNQKAAEALPLAQRVHEYMLRLLPEDDVGLCPSMVTLGQCLQYLGRQAEAETLLIKALDITQRAEGHEHPKTIRCCTLLAMVWHTMGKYEQAEALHRRAVDFDTQLLGAGDPQTIGGITSLAQCLLEQPGKVEEGVSLLHKCVELYIRTVGLQHYNTLFNMYMLGRAYICNLHDPVKAERTLRKARLLSLRVFGPEHHLTLETTDAFIGSLMHNGKGLEALPLRREHLQLLRRHRGEEHPDTLLSTCNLANVLNGLGEVAEAEPLARKALEACTQVLGPGHGTTERAAAILAVCRKAVPQARAAQQGKSRRGGRR